MSDLGTFILLAALLSSFAVFCLFHIHFSFSLTLPLDQYCETALVVLFKKTMEGAAAAAGADGTIATAAVPNEAALPTFGTYLEIPLNDLELLEIVG